LSFLSARTAWMRPIMAWSRTRLYKEHQGIHGLVLGGSSDVSMHRQVGQEGLARGFGGEEICARPQAVDTDESYDPLPSGALRVPGVMVHTEQLSPVVAQVGWWLSRRGRQLILPWWRPQIADHTHRAHLPDKPAHIALSGHHGKLING
jgi:hypothetical protein